MSTLLSQTDDAVAFLAERAQAQRDEAADAEYERRERAANRIIGVRGFDEVLEQIAAMPDTKKAEVMDSYGSDADFVWLWSTMFSDAFEAATNLRVDQGD